MLVTLACACGGSSGPTDNKAACMKAETAQPMLQPLQSAITQSDAAGASTDATNLAMTLMASQKLVVKMTTVQHDLDDSLMQVDLIEMDVSAAPPDFTSAMDAFSALQTQMDQLSADCALVLCP